MLILDIRNVYLDVLYSIFRYHSGLIRYLICKNRYLIDKIDILKIILDILFVKSI